jgi:hypothetical protein
MCGGGQTISWSQFQGQMQLKSGSTVNYVSRLFVRAIVVDTRLCSQNELVEALHTLSKSGLIYPRTCACNLIV